VRTLTDGKGADVIYDTVGPALVEQALEAIAIGGRYIMIGFAGGGDFPTIESFKVLSLGISVTGALHSVRTTEERDEAVHVLGRMFSAGDISMPIDQVVPFADVAAALHRLGGGVNGKLIARIGEAPT